MTDPDPTNPKTFKAHIRKLFAELQELLFETIDDGAGKPIPEAITGITMVLAISPVEEIKHQREDGQITFRPAMYRWPDEDDDIVAAELQAGLDMLEDPQTATEARSFGPPGDPFDDPFEPDPNKKLH